MVLDRILRLFAGQPAAEPAFTRDAAGAFVFTGSVAIGAAPDRLRRMLDPDDAENRWRLRGDALAAVDRARGLYRLNDRRMPEAPFLMQVERKTATDIAILTTGDGGAPIGAVETTTSHYAIAASAGGAVVTLTERARFLDGLPEMHRRRHAKLMAKAVAKDLQRLKVEAERGAA